MGGGWDSLVKITKPTLKSMTHNRPIREDQLITTLVQIEGTINSRPLTSTSDDTDDLTVLTKTRNDLERPETTYNEQERPETTCNEQETISNNLKQPRTRKKRNETTYHE